MRGMVVRNTGENGGLGVSFHVYGLQVTKIMGKRGRGGRRGRERGRDGQRRKRDVR